MSRTFWNSLPSTSARRRRLHRNLQLESVEARNLMAVLTVDTVVDVVDAQDGATSLREAVIAANEVPVGEDARIVFDASIDGRTIYLSEGELFVQRSVVIDGLSVERGISIDASHSDADPNVAQGDGSRIFLIDDGSAAFRSDVQLLGLTLRGGDSADSGGAIRTAERLTLIQSTLENNHSMATGGAISADCDVACEALVVLDHVEIANNSAHEAGGVFVAGTLSAREVNVHDNVATVGAGGLQATRGAASIQLRDSFIENNHGGSTGGVLATAIGGTATVSVLTSKFTGNVGSNTGGVMAFGAASDVTIDASQFVGNTSTGGGGAIFSNTTGGEAKVVISQSTFADNHGGSGGALFVRGTTSSSDVTISSSTFTANQSLRGGGSIAANTGSGKVRVEHSTIVDSQGSQGGGIWLATEALKMSNSIVAGNTATTGPDLWKGPHAADIQYSLIGNRKDTGLAAAPVDSPSSSGNIVGSAAVPIDPRLGALAENGGPTLTRVPLANSPVVNAGAMSLNDLPRSDQRRFPYVRVSGGRLDMGAIEVQATPAGSSAAAASSVSLKISEVNYNPGAPSPAEVDAGFAADDFEFIELTNISSEAIDLSQVAFVKVPVPVGGVIEDQGVDFEFADGVITELAPGATVLVVENMDAMQLRYGAGLPMAGEWSGQLSNDGELITVASLAPEYEVIAQFRYEKTWFPPTDGGGKTLEVRILAATNLSVSSSWSESSDEGGSPGSVSSEALVYGDSNNDGRFTSADLVLSFGRGKYVVDAAQPDSPTATWIEGDWDMDGYFTSHDLVLAFQRSVYEDT